MRLVIALWCCAAWCVSTCLAPLAVGVLFAAAALLTLLLLVPGWSIGDLSTAREHLPPLLACVGDGVDGCVMLWVGDCEMPLLLPWVGGDGDGVGVSVGVVVVVGLSPSPALFFLHLLPAVGDDVGCSVGLTAVVEDAAAGGAFWVMAALRLEAGLGRQ